MGPALAAGLLQGAGSLIGGFARNKAAKKLKKSVDTTMLRAGKETREDQARAIEYRASDEARLRAASGYDLSKLRDDAVAAGFNPLTVLQATGGVGYDGRGAVLTTPFISKAETTIRHAELQAGVGGALVETAGYIGDAISGGASAYFGQANEMMRNATERMALDAMLRPDASMSPTSAPFGGKAVIQASTRPVVSGSPFAVTPTGGFLKFDEFGYGSAKDGGDRPIEINPAQNEPWFKEIQIWGDSYKVWNDEASESEIAATLMLTTLPHQWAYKNAGPLYQKGVTMARDWFGADMSRDAKASADKVSNTRRAQEFFKAQNAKIARP